MALLFALFSLHRAECCQLSLRGEAECDMSAGTQSLENSKMERLLAVMVFSFPSLGVQH